MHNQLRLILLSFVITTSAVCAFGQTNAAQSISLEPIANAFAVNSGEAQTGNGWADVRSIRGIKFDRDYSNYRQDFPKSLNGKARIMDLGAAQIAFAGVQSIVMQAEITIEGVGVDRVMRRETLIGQLPNATSITSVKSCHLPNEIGTRFLIYAAVFRGKKPIFIEMMTSEGSGGASLTFTFVQQLSDLAECK